MAGFSIMTHLMWHMHRLPSTMNYFHFASQFAGFRKAVLSSSDYSSESRQGLDCQVRRLLEDAKPCPRIIERVSTALCDAGLLMRFAARKWCYFTIVGVLTTTRAFLGVLTIHSRQAVAANSKRPERFGLMVLLGPTTPEHESFSRITLLALQRKRWPHTGAQQLRTRIWQSVCNRQFQSQCLCPRSDMHSNALLRLVSYFIGSPDPQSGIE